MWKARITSRLLQEGFGDLIYRYRLTSRGGRGNIENEIDALQNAEKQGKVAGVHVFIYDLDRAPSGRHSTDKVKVMQWRRYGLENYLLEPDIIYHLLRDVDIAQKHMETLGEAPALLKALAMEQIPELAARQTFADLNFKDEGLPSREFRGVSWEEASAKAYRRLASIREQIEALDERQWKEKCEARFRALSKKLEEKWEESWIIQCNGKQVLMSVHSQFSLRISPLKFKLRLLQEMKNRDTENWRLMSMEMRNIIS